MRPLKCAYAAPLRTGASRPRTSTACPRARLAASPGPTLSPGMSSSAASTGRRMHADGRPPPPLRAASANRPRQPRRSRRRACAAAPMTCAGAAERAAHVASQRAHVGAFAALGLQHRRRRVRHVDEPQILDDDPARLEHHRLAAAGEVVGALAVDLDGRERRRHLADLAGEVGRTSAISSADREPLGGAYDLPFASSVSVSTPKRTVKR